MTSVTGELELSTDRQAANDPRAGVRVITIAPLMARIVGVVVFTGFPAIAFIFLLIEHTSVPLLILSAPLLLATTTLQIFYFHRTGVDLHSPLSYAALAVQALMIYLPLWFLYGEPFTGMPVIVAGTALLVLPRVLRWVAYAAVVVSGTWIESLLTDNPVDVAYTAVGISVFGLQLYGMTRLVGLISELHEVRSELARSAVAHERLRFARNLHDLLGDSLTAIAPKCEQAKRLVNRDPDRARHEIADIIGISRRTLADARAVAHGYRDINLEEESRTAESVLAASRVEVRMERRHGDLPAHVRTLLAAVLRQGVADVLEHGTDERCAITVREHPDRISLDITCKVPAPRSGAAEASRADGSWRDVAGAALAARVAELRGELTAGTDADGWYRLHLDLPVVADEERDGMDEQVSQRSVTFARSLIAVVFFGQCVLTGLHYPGLTDKVIPVVVTSGCLLAMLLIQLYFATPETRLRSRFSYVLLVAEAVLVYLPLVEFGLAWLPLPGFLAGSALLVMRPRVAWLVVVAVVASAGAAQYVVTGTALDSLYSSVSAVIHGAIVYGLTWMVRAMAELHATRVQLAEAAVFDERLRFARDLHDLLGLSLSAIALKSDLADRLVTAAPEKAQAELTEILGISRLALADVRLVASGYRDLSLNEAVRTAESLLASTQVDVHLDLKVGELPNPVGTLLATVLREGVTNVLRHSNAARCEITVKQQDETVLLDIVNDGVARQATTTRTDGSGLGNLAYRVAARGGELTAGIEPEGRFRLRVKVPATDPVTIRQRLA